MAAVLDLRRLVRNAALLPRRTWASLHRRFASDYALERRAKAAVAGWFAPDYLERLDAVPGMCSSRTGRVLALLAAEAPAGGDIVEIGAWKGRITVWLVEAAARRPDRPRVISIDPHLRDSWDGFCRTVDDFKLAERGLQVVRQRSHDAARGWSRPISLLWIDGSHDYDDVRRDIADYAPHVIAGGWIAFDDSSGGEFPGVERAIAEWQADARDIARVATLRNMTIFRRTP
jgi:MMP 1-O-methyltransferase